MSVRTEIRKVTIEQEVYIASDGKEFLDEGDCLSHDYNLLEQKLNLYTANFEEACSIDECIYAALKTEEDVDIFKQCCDYIGIDATGVERPGMYMYIEHAYFRSPVIWINLNETLDKLEGNSDEHRV